MHIDYRNYTIYISIHRKPLRILRNWRPFQGPGLAWTPWAPWGLGLESVWDMKQNHRKTIGKPWENGGSMGFNEIYPLVNKHSY